MLRAIVSERSGTAGFSLVEVMSALVIASLAMVVLLRGLGGSQLAAVYLEAHLGARLIAQSKMNGMPPTHRQATGRASRACINGNFPSSRRWSMVLEDHPPAIGSIGWWWK